MGWSGTQLWTRKLAFIWCNRDQFRPTSEYRENWSCGIVGKNTGIDGKRRPQSSIEPNRLKKNLELFDNSTVKKKSELLSLRESVQKVKEDQELLRKRMFAYPHIAKFSEKDQEVRIAVNTYLTLNSYF